MNNKYSGNYQRVAKNTFFLYCRQIIILFISLFTSRIVLNALGVEDYGINNVVGGFVSIFSIISGAFGHAIVRFLAYVLEDDDSTKLSGCFSTAIIVQTVMGGLVCLLLASIGGWYVSNIMVLPDGREHAALWVLLFSSVSFFISLISVPYNALIMAQEHMKAVAYIGIVEAVLKMIVALIVKYINFDKLVVFSMLSIISALIVRMIYAGYCLRAFPTCRFTLHINYEMFKEMMQFSGWAFLGNGAFLLKDQGVNMIVNLFGGTTANAARGIASSVSNAVKSLTNNYIQAIQPQITKLCSLDKKDEMLNMIYRSSRYAYYLMLILFFPVIKNLDYLLQIWLGQIPQYSESFILAILIETIIISLYNPMLYGVLATGKIKVYEITMSVTYISSLPLSYWALKRGCPMVSVYYIVILLAIIVMMILIWQSSSTYGLSCTCFCRKVLIRIGIVTVLSKICIDLININSGIRFVDFAVESFLSVGIVAVIMWTIGMEKVEKEALLLILNNKIKRNN